MAHFHYDREERQRRLSGYAREMHGRKKGGLFKKNRSLAIILIDLGVILVIAAIMWFYIRTRADEELYEGLVFAGEAYFIDNRVFATLVIERTNDSIYTGMIRATFQAPGADDYTIESSLPIEIGETQRIRGLLKVSDVPENIAVILSAAGDQRILSLSVETP